MDRPSLDAYRDGPLGPYLAGAVPHEIRDDAALPPGQALIVSIWQLQDIRDYRRAIQTWFAGLRVGGRLILAVPHAFLHERLNVLPSPWNPAARRLYTPAALVEEIEEALAPNSYRLRLLADADQGYDYAADRAVAPIGRHDVVAVIERIAPPAWGLDEDYSAERSPPADAFEPDHTRIERTAPVAAQRILALKLDHLGDFVMGLPALHRLRAAFPDAAIDLVVGSWNETLAREAGVADRVMVFNAYPRHSGEEPVDVPARKPAFDAFVTGDYDIAIDLRVEPDTRLFLRDLAAPVKAALGDRARFPWLTIALPADITRHGHERAWEDMIGPTQFGAQPFCDQDETGIRCDAARVPAFDGAFVWGPYRRLQPGAYLFEPFLTLDPAGRIAWDIALDIDRHAAGEIAGPDPVRIAFTVERPDTHFEFRLWPADGAPLPDFAFYGGRLLKQGAEAVLHHSEYLALLVELLAMRMGKGMFGEHGPR